MPHDLKLWCEDCQTSYDGECEVHGPFTHVTDTEIGSRARRSLPHILELKEEKNKKGIFTKENLARRIQFGPLQGVIERDPKKQLESAEEIKKRYGITYKLLEANNELCLIDTRFEEHSNWMIFVRPAERKLEQNLVAFQYRGQIFFATIKGVPAENELRVWYSKEYAEIMGVTHLTDDGSPWQFRARPKYSCLSCQAIFSSSANLANHRCPKRQVVSKIVGFPSRKRIRRRTRHIGSVLPKPPLGTPVIIELPSTSKEIELKPVIAAPTITKPLSFRAKLKSTTTVREKKLVPHETDSSDSEEVAAEAKTPVLAKGSYQCSLCNKVFHSPGKLKQHSYSHTGEKPFTCPHCHKAFSSRFKLGRHQLIHTGVRQHQCPLCSRSFHRKDHLKNHIQIHDPNKQFKCDRPDCGKEYNSYMSYRKHCAVHAAEDGDLECKICYEMFENKDELINHLKVHVGTRTVKSPSEKKFQCDYCERKFFTRKDVKRHLVVHTGKRDFICSLCPQKFGRKDHLVRHIKKSHGISDPTRLDISDPLAVPGPSSAPQALSPEAAFMSSTSASSGDQPFFIGEPETITVTEPLSVTTKLLIEPSSEPYEIGSFPSDIRFFGEAIKEECFFDAKEDPELTASIMDPGGDDLSKILGMYLPSGSINLTVPPLLGSAATSPLEEEAIQALSHAETEVISAPLIMVAGESHLTPSNILPVSASEELSQVYDLPSEQILETPDVPPQQITADDERERPPQTVTSTTQPATSTTTSSTSTTLPGFRQAFP